MKFIYLIIAIGALVFNENYIIDFKSNDPAVWKTVNDVVMGGISSSKFEIIADGTARFSGKVSLENNGGFSSVRRDWDLADFIGYDGLLIKLYGDGKLYNLRVRTDTNFDGISYQAKFQTKKDLWDEIKIPLSDFVPTFRGRFVDNQPKLESQNIRQIGILIADKQYGEFSIDIERIELYRK